jgi:hypothetical protein
VEINLEKLKLTNSVGNLTAHPFTGIAREFIIILKMLESLGVWLRA